MHTLNLHTRALFTYSFHVWKKTSSNCAPYCLSHVNHPEKVEISKFLEKTGTKIKKKFLNHHNDFLCQLCLPNERIQATDMETTSLKK